MDKALLNAEEEFSCHELLPRGAALTRHSLVPLPYGRYTPPAPCSTCLDEGRKLDGLEGLRPPAVDLYAGGGGLLYGVNRHFDAQHAVETDGAACATLRANFPGLHVHHTTVEEYRRGSRSPAPGRVALLVAGPPWYVDSEEELTAARALLGPITSAALVRDRT